MTKTTTTEQRELGKTVLARFAQQRNVPAALKPFIRAFAERHRALETAACRVDRARNARDAALATVGEADTKLDWQIDALANRVVGADLGPRKNPFAPFSEIPPARLKELGYALEIERVRKLVAAIEKAKPPPTVRSALAACAAAATAGEKALRSFAGPQTDYTASIADRDALLPDWLRALERLRLHAKAAWVDQPAIYRAVFAPPGIAAAHGRRRKRKNQESMPSAPGDTVAHSEPTTSASDLP